MKIRDRIEKALHDKGDLSVKELVDILHVSKQAIHVALKQLLEEEVIVKFGRTPKTIYRLNSGISPVSADFSSIAEDSKQYLSNRFLLITETGKMLQGIEGFNHWCKQLQLPLEKTLKEFLTTRIKYDAYINVSGLIDGKQKISNTRGYDNIYLN